MDVQLFRGKRFNMVIKSFRQSHPLVLFSYITSMLLLMIIQSHYVVITAGFISLVLVCFKSNVTRFKKSIKYLLVLLFLITVTNPIFVSEGMDVLYQNNYFTITKQALIYGFFFVLLIVSMLLVVSLAKEYMNDSQIIYLFGSILPTLGLVISMCFNLISRLKNQYQKIKEANLLIPYKNKIKKQYQLIVMLITYAFESSLEMINSMNARGYGQGHRSSFHLYRFKKDDLLKLLIIIVLDLVIIFGYVNYYDSFYYYPMIQNYQFNFLDIIFIGSLVVLIILPLLFKGGKKNVSD